MPTKSSSRPPSLLATGHYGLLTSMRTETWMSCWTWRTENVPSSLLTPLCSISSSSLSVPCFFVVYFASPPAHSRYAYAPLDAHPSTPIMHPNIHHSSHFPCSHLSHLFNIFLLFSLCLPLSPITEQIPHDVFPVLTLCSPFPRLSCFVLFSCRILARFHIYLRIVLQAHLSLSNILRPCRFCAIQLLCLNKCARTPL